MSLAHCAPEPSAAPRCRPCPRLRACRRSPDQFDDRPDDGSDEHAEQQRFPADEHPRAAHEQNVAHAHALPPGDEPAHALDEQKNRKPGDAADDEIRPTPLSREAEEKGVARGKQKIGDLHSVVGEMIFPIDPRHHADQPDDGEGEKRLRREPEPQESREEPEAAEQLEKEGKGPDLFAAAAASAPLQQPADERDIFVPFQRPAAAVAVRPGRNDAFPSRRRRRPRRRS